MLTHMVGWKILDLSCEYVFLYKCSLESKHCTILFLDLQIVATENQDQLLLYLNCFVPVIKVSYHSDGFVCSLFVEVDAS